MTLILMVIACVCLLLQALQVNIKRIEIGWLGLFFWCLAVTLPMLLSGQVTPLYVLVVVLVIVVLVVFYRRPRA